MIYHCCSELRRNKIEGTSINGIDFLEVIDQEAPTKDERQRFLRLHFVNDLSGPPLTTDNIIIAGGERVTHFKVLLAKVISGDPLNILTIELDRRGDFSIYRLSVVQDADHDQPPAGYDPVLASINFSFKVECESDFDCVSDCFCPPPTYDEPDIDYLAKDYTSFRRLMLDRMAALVPQWTERSPADLGVAMVELLAYVGDHLSYQQDAVATEAYLETARSRVSVRRHALLVDYSMHDGGNARTWVQVEVSADIVSNPPGQPVLAKGTQFTTRIIDQPLVLEDDLPLKRKSQAVFESMEDVQALYLAHNQLSFYTWSDRECCLPVGSTRATLKGHFPHLKDGDVLIVEERLGPKTGVAGDADLEQRHAIRLKTVRFLDESNNPLTDLVTNEKITEISWHKRDALPFPLCISSRSDRGEYLEDVSVALGNIVLVDHGLTLYKDSKEGEDLGHVPGSTRYIAPTSKCDPCQDGKMTPIQPRYRPILKETALTMVGEYSPTKSADEAMNWDLRAMEPALRLKSKLNGNERIWQAEWDLLDNDEDDAVFVVEIENDGRAYIRFGDSQHGARPQSNVSFQAYYRIGNGRRGNIGAESLVHIVKSDHSKNAIPKITSVRNPLPAVGGLEPETMEHVRQIAPSAFRTQERAVTEKDYADKVSKIPEVQRGAATFRWTGSWHTVFLTVDRERGAQVDPIFSQQVQDEIEPYRMAGYDLDISAPQFVPLEIAMTVCVKPDYFRSHVKQALLRTISNRVLPDGTTGLFHPDRFTFGQPVYLSTIYEAAQRIPGVYSTLITIFQRKNQPDEKPKDEGVLELGHLEIARLDNDPNYPENGVFTLMMEGGR